MLHISTCEDVAVSVQEGTKCHFAVSVLDSTKWHLAVSVQESTKWHLAISVQEGTKCHLDGSVQEGSKVTFCQKILFDSTYSRKLIVFQYLSKSY